MRKDSPFRVYSVAGHIGWLVATPLLFFIGGGGWLISRFELDSRLMVVFVLAGLAVMISAVGAYLRTLLRQFGDSPVPENKENPPPKYDRRDYDYYDK